MEKQGRLRAITQPSMCLTHVCTIQGIITAVFGDSRLTSLSYCAKQRKNVMKIVNKPTNTPKAVFLSLTNVPLLLPSDKNARLYYNKRVKCLKGRGHILFISRYMVPPLLDSKQALPLRLSLQLTQTSSHGHRHILNQAPLASPSLVSSTTSGSL